MEFFLTAISICGYSLKPPLSSLRPQIMFSSFTCKINSPPTAPESYPIIASARIHPLDRYRSRRLCFLGTTPYIQLLDYKTLNLNSSKSRLAGQWAPGICFHLPNTKACHHAWHFDACSGDQTQVLLLARQAFFSPSHLPISFLYCFVFRDRVLLCCSG